ncbi:MAG: transporter substrate-binding domain-containing protein, partial [Saccharospirillum sp.]
MWVGIAALLPLHTHAETDPSAQPRTLRVGLYQNKPKLFTNATGEPAGIFVELLNAIAAEQNWTLDYRPCNWSQCLRWLETDQLDLMPDVALNSERQQRFDFHLQPALNSWSQLYSRPNPPIVSIFQLNGASVTLLRDSVQLPFFKSMLANFGIEAQLIEASDYLEAFSKVSDGEADAAVSNNLYGALHAAHYNLVATPIVFQPSQLYFATRQGHNTELLAAIDRQLTAWRADSDSLYFEILNRWQSVPPKPLIPRWLILSLISALTLLVVTLLLITWLRHRVAIKTRALTDSERKLATILDNVGAFIYIKNNDLKYQYANRLLLDFLG